MFWYLFWVVLTELDPGIVGRLPTGGQLLVEDCDVIETPVQASTLKGRELDLGDVEPGAVFGRVVDFEPFGQAAGVHGIENCLSVVPASIRFC